jgi:hypothetical protein
MFDDFLKFLKSLRKEKKTGITATDQAEKKLQEAADQFTKKQNQMKSQVVLTKPLNLVNLKKAQR